MDKPKLFSEEVIKEFIKLVIIIITYTITKSSTSNQSLTLMDMIEDSIVIILVSVIYFFIFSVFYIIKKPIKIVVDLKNYTNSKNLTTIYRTGVLREDTRTIMVNVKVFETNSMWNTLALKLLKRSEICICINAVPQNESLICQPKSVSQDMDIVKDGLIINIDNLILGNLEHRICIERNYRFTVSENRDRPFECNQEIPIKPYLIINKKKLNLFNKMLCDFSYAEKEGKHVVEFIK